MPTEDARPIEIVAEAIYESDRHNRHNAEPWANATATTRAIYLRNAAAAIDMIAPLYGPMDNSSEADPVRDVRERMASDEAVRACVEGAAKFIPGATEGQVREVANRVVKWLSQAGYEVVRRGD